MLRVNRNVLGHDEALKVLEVAKNGKYEKVVQKSTDRSDYSCSYSRWVTNDPVIRSAVQKIAASVGRNPGQFFVYRMDEGDHFRLHKDSGMHVVYYLSEGWQEEWGGVLELEGNQKFVPEFDASVAVSHMTTHWVTPITGDKPRYTILVKC